jgi:hypothetical protein
VGIARCLAIAATGDLDRTLGLAQNLVGRHEQARIGLIECGQPSALAREVAGLLTRAGRVPVTVLVKDRELAQSDALLHRLAGVSAVWVFADNLLETYLIVFATRLTFALRRAAHEGLPVIGVGAGAVALGGLLVARHVCARTQYDLASGLGWAPRMLLDGGADRHSMDSSVAQAAVSSLPGLLGVDLGSRGGLKLVGERLESVGDEPLVLLGSDALGHLIRLQLEPGQVTTVAPPPFAPFRPDVLAQSGAALSQVVRPAAPPAIAMPVLAAEHGSGAPSAADGRLCPMCHRVHTHNEARVEFAA